MRRTAAAVQVAKALLADQAGGHYGWELSRAAGVQPATMYRVLSRMLEVEWLVDGWEDPASTGGRPPRRYYRATVLGLAHLHELAGDLKGKNGRG